MTIIIYIYITCISIALQNTFKVKSYFFILCLLLAALFSYSRTSTNSTQSQGKNYYRHITITFYLNATHKADLKKVPEIVIKK